ncbi:NADH-specific methylglyoxal reductase [Burkholderiales bacterium]|nr:NADH-specific methylglyoxal reductase [Burkholderiales bacterium]
MSVADLPPDPARRRALAALAGTAATLALPRRSAAATGGAIHTRPIPSTGERVPVIGLGTWITFDVGDSVASRAELLSVLRDFLAAGGRVVDSSPMYGSAEAVIGELAGELRRPPMFSATKIWTFGRWAGERQVERSRSLWGLERLDLVQVHNLLDWRTHLPTLAAMKREGRIRYLGITTSHGRRHDELERAMREVAFDFVQFTYSVADRDAEPRLLPLARDRGAAVIANRPFDGGALFDRVRGRALPAWAAEIDCANWAQVFLKFIVSHPAVTCAIPATSQAAHLRENVGALTGRLPDGALRQRIVRELG